MTVEHQIGGARDQFPVGMRVLAVDDDPTCLLLLETLLRRCQYHVTTTSQAVAALKMLRENPNRFDLVISDVHMPDIDGFKLLELVGLEMDLPVIMLSANGDPKLVMKGITHGACDYLLKPIRIEELKNIWQHVIRRRRHDNRDRYVDNTERPPNGNNEATSEQKLTKKRKEQNEEEDDQDRDDNGHENDDPTTQKKPRVVWSVDLHRKFVAAVNQLGIDKAVPKKILDLMNVEKLTRENVASHLQKYRLYLKRISTVANQQAHMVAALGGTDPTYLQMGSVPGLGFPNLSGSGQFHNPTLRSLPSNGILSRLNSPAGLGMRGLPSPGVIQLGQMQNSGHLSNSQTHFQPVMHNDRNVLQGMPTSLALDQIQSNKAAAFPTIASSSSGQFLGTQNCWSADASQSTVNQSNTFPLTDCFNQTANVHLSDGMSEMALRSTDSSAVSSLSNATQVWNDQRLDAIYQSNSVISSGINGNNSVFSRTRSFDSARQPTYIDSSLMRNNESENLALEALMRSTERYQKNPTSYNSNNFGSLEDIAGVIVKQEPDRGIVADDFGCGLFS